MINVTPSRYAVIRDRGLSTRIRAMPAKKSAQRTPSPASTPVLRRAVPASVAVSAAVAGAARRRAARKHAERTEAAPQPALSRKRAPAARKASGGATKSTRAGSNWVKAARGLRREASPKQVKRDVKKVLDKGVSKADQLLESAMKWAVKLAIRAKALYDMLHAWWNGKFDFPTGTLQAMAVALLYFISPFDIIPDFLPLFGLIDDAAVFAFVFSRIRQDLEAYAESTGKSLSDIGL